MENNSEHINIDLITRYLSGETSELENIQLVKWISSDYSNQMLFEEYEKTWKSLDHFKGKSLIDIEKEWKKIDFVIRSKEARKSKKSKFSYHFSQIAAILIFVILSGAGVAFLANEVRYETVKTTDNTQEVFLPDGTEIMLNANSKLKYLKKFERKERRINLNGEAFFNVTADSTKPFRINVTNAVVEVLGTSFNVNAFDENENIEVVVAKGTVSLASKTETNEKVVLQAGDRGVLYKKKAKVRKDQNINRNYNAWMTKVIVFENEKLIHIVNEINKVYHTNIIIRNPKIGDCKITVTFDNKSLDAILTILENTLDITISRTDNAIIFDGEGC